MKKSERMRLEMVKSLIKTKTHLRKFLGRFLGDFLAVPGIKIVDIFLLGNSVEEFLINWNNFRFVTRPRPPHW